MYPDVTPPEQKFHNGVFCELISSSSEYWSENRALFVEGLRWAPSASFLQVLLAFGVTSVARSLASNRNWTTRTGCRRCLWPGALEAISLSPCRVPYNPPMPPVTQRTFCSNSLLIFPSAFFCKQSFCHLHYLNSSNYSTRMIGFFTQNIRNLFVKSFSKQRYWGDTLPILCVKIFEANCANILGNSNEIKNNRRCHL